MKRLVISEFDENGTKWYHSPTHKEVKTGFFTDKNISMPSKQEQEVSASFHSDNKLRRDKFYDFFRRATINGEPRINLDELNKNLTIKIDELPDSSKVSLIFEELDSKSSLASRGKKNWSEQEIIFFVWLVMNYCYLNKLNYIDMDDREWDKIAEIFPGRNSEQCKLRWQSLLKMNLSKAPWTQEEDEILVQVINDKGPKKWKEIAIEMNKRLGNLKLFRQGKQCRERWINHLDPAINRGTWTAEEDIKLLETHNQIGKRWAEIAKILKNRTENSVKNRWNSLIKKYKSEYNVDSDGVSPSSNYSTSSMNDLERRISEQLILQKRRMSSTTESESPETYSQSQMQEVPEESDEDDDTGDTPAGESNSNNASASTGPAGKGIEEEKDKMSDKKTIQRKKIPSKPVDVNKHKANLMEMITKERSQSQLQNQRPQQPEKKEIAAPLFPQTNKNIPENIALQSLMQNANIFNMGNMGNMGNNPGFPGLMQPPQEALNGANPLSLLNSFPSPGQFNSLTNEMLNLNLNLGLWQQSPTSFGGINNLINQNLQQKDLASNVLEMYTQANQRPFQQNPNFSSLLNNAPNSLPEQDLPNSLENFNKMDVRKQSDGNKMNTEDSEPIVHKFFEKSIEELMIPENPSNSLQHAIVDRETGHIYFLSPVNKDTLSLNKPCVPFNPGFNGIDIFGNSPALGARTWASPNLNSGVFNGSLSQLATLGLGGAAISPNLGLAQNSPGAGAFFNQNFNVERKSNEWTPENTAKTPLSMLNNKSRVISQIDKEKGLTAPGNSGTVFSKRTSIVDKSKNNSFSTTESSKFDSPSSFLEAGQARGLNFKGGEATKVPVRQIM